MRDPTMASLSFTLRAPQMIFVCPVNPSATATYQIITDANEAARNHLPRASNFWRRSAELLTLCRTLSALHRAQRDT